MKIEHEDVSDDIVIQGSRGQGIARPGRSDIDVAVRVDPNKFDDLIRDAFGTPNPGSAKHRTMQMAIQEGRIVSGRAGLRQLRRALEDLIGLDVDISIIRRGGPFDTGPTLPLP